MDPPELSRSGSGSTNKRHSRNISYSNRTSASTAQPSPPTATETALIPISPTSSSTATTSNPLSPPKPLAARPRSRSPLPTTPQRDLSFLLRPSNFYKVSQTDIPPPFRSTPAGSDTTLSSLLRQGHYYHATLLAVSTLTSTPDLSPRQIFELLYARLACLTLMNETSLAGKESLILGDIHSPFYLSEETGECILPWELRVLAVRLQAFAVVGDVRRAVQGYYDLASYARGQIRSSVVEDKSVWKQRLRDLGIRIGNALVEIGDLEAGRRHYESLLEATPKAEEKRMLEGWVAMLCLRMGDLEGAKGWIRSRDDDDDGAEADDVKSGSEEVLKALFHMAQGEYEDAANTWRSLLDGPYGVLAKQNLAVCLLYTGRLTETQQILDSLIDENHAFYALTFNLATVYELSTDRSKEKKTQLAERVAEGVRKGGNAEGDCRRMARSNVDFKL
ncbi:MAG: hypothetical protein Q9166_006570 [cf. Caloplaca sp. 2 TL-2023]